MALWFWIYQLTLSCMACFHLASLAHLFALWPQNLSRLLQQCKSLYRAWTSRHCQISTCFKISVLKFCTNNSQASQRWLTVRILNNRILEDNTSSWDELWLPPLCMCMHTCKCGCSYGNQRATSGVTLRPPAFQDLMTQFVQWKAKWPFWQRYMFFYSVAHNMVNVSFDNFFKTIA